MWSTHSALPEEIAPPPQLVFSLTRLRQNASDFHALCASEFVPGTYEAYFPVKVAPSQEIVQCLLDINFGLEIINQKALKIGCYSEDVRTILSGPAKSPSLIAERCWTYVSCESLSDLMMVDAAARCLSSPLAVLLRIKATPKRRLGMSLADARWAVTHADTFANVQLVGLHIHSGSNLSEREGDLLLERMREVTADLTHHGLRTQVLNFGGGMPCIDGNERQIQRRLRCYAELAGVNGASTLVEPGRALVGDAARLVASVVDVRPADREITINSAAYVVHGPCNSDKFILHQQNGLTVPRRYDVVKRRDANYRIGGIWPAEGDTLWISVENPNFHIGDSIIFPHAGAYTLGFLEELSFGEILPTITI